jgi:hypothetical protein
VPKFMHKISRDKTACEYSISMDLKITVLESVNSIYLAWDTDRHGGLRQKRYPTLSFQKQSEGFLGELSDYWVLKNRSTEVRNV